MMEPREPYGSIIEWHLKSRGQRADDYHQHPIFKESRYVVRMCFDLLESIGANGGKSVSIEDVIRAERSAAGHVDYHSKAALYMDELARGVHPMQHGGEQ